MKKLTTILAVTILAFTAVANAKGILTDDKVRGDLRYCYYSDGSVVTIDRMSICKNRN